MVRSLAPTFSRVYVFLVPCCSGAFMFTLLAAFVRLFSSAPNVAPFPSPSIALALRPRWTIQPCGVRFFCTFFSSSPSAHVGTVVVVDCAHASSTLPCVCYFSTRLAAWHECMRHECMWRCLVQSRGVVVRSVRRCLCSCVRAGVSWFMRSQPRFAFVPRWCLGLLPGFVSPSDDCAVGSAAAEAGAAVAAM